MFLLLANLETGKVRVGELKLMFLFEVLHHAAVVCVTRLHRQGEPDKKEKDRVDSNYTYMYRLVHM